MPIFFVEATTISDGRVHTEVCEIHVRLERLSGPPAAWTRANKVFLDDIRRQFLLWRTLDDEEREQYLAMAAEAQPA